MGRSLADDSSWVGKSPEYREFYGDLEEIKRKYAPKIPVAPEKPRVHNYQQRKQAQKKKRSALKPREAKRTVSSYVPKTARRVPEGYVETFQVTKTLGVHHTTTRRLIKKLGIEKVMVWRKGFVPLSCVPVLQAELRRERPKVERPRKPKTPRVRLDRRVPDPVIPEGWLSTRELASALGITKRAIKHFIQRTNAVKGEDYFIAKTVAYFSPAFQERYRAFREGRKPKGRKPYQKKPQSILRDELRAQGFVNFRVMVQQLKTGKAQLGRIMENLGMGTRVGQWIMLSPEEQATLTKLFDGWRNGGKRAQ